jgi:hypothetical protein
MPNSTLADDKQADEEENRASAQWDVWRRAQGLIRYLSGSGHRVYGAMFTSTPKDNKIDFTNGRNNSAMFFNMRNARLG